MLITYQAKLLSKTQLAPEVFLFKFTRPDDPNWTYLPGQYMIFHIPQPDNHPVRRLYSILSTPHNTESLDFVIEYVHGGKGSEYLAKLSIGAETTFQGPAGIFTLKESPRNKIFLATGTGIAPIKNIIDSVLLFPEPKKNEQIDKENMLLSKLQHLGDQKRMYLFWGMKTCEDMYFQDELINLSQKFDHFYFRYCLSRETDIFGKLGDKARHVALGRVTAGLEDLLLHYEYKITDFDFYICGGPVVVEALRTYLAEKKVPKEQIIFEKFTA
jgi:NAD(P)H-flavin reductase